MHRTLHRICWATDRPLVRLTRLDLILPQVPVLESLNLHWVMLILSVQCDVTLGVVFLLLFLLKASTSRIVIQMLSVREPILKLLDLVKLLIELIHLSFPGVDLRSLYFIFILNLILQVVTQDFVRLQI